MSISNLAFTKNWENSTDFPTVETSETQVRKDLQLLHDEAKTKINEVIAALNLLSAAGLYVADKSSVTIANLVSASSADQTILLLDSGLLYYSADESESEGTYTFNFFTVDGTSIKTLSASGTTTGTITWTAGTTYDLSALAPLASPALTGEPTAPTAAASDNTTKIATTAHVKSTIGRTTAVDASDTNYTTLMVRGESLHSSDTTPSVNGAICWTYE